MLLFPVLSCIALSVSACLCECKGGSTYPAGVHLPATWEEKGGKGGAWGAVGRPGRERRAGPEDNSIKGNSPDSIIFNWRAFCKSSSSNTIEVGAAVMWAAIRPSPGM